jgi:membrane protein YqaA with SNARE-associated domain
LTYLTQLLISWGPHGVLLLAVVDSAGIPLPGGVDALLVLLAAKYGAVAYWFAGLAVLGSMIGNGILFYLGRESGELYFARRVHKPGTKRYRAWFQHYGLITVFIPALVPIIPLPLKVFVISAGVLGLRPAAFLAVVLVARIPRYFAMTYLGSQLGLYSMTYLKSRVWHLVAIAAGLLLLSYLLIKIADRYRKV